MSKKVGFTTTIPVEVILSAGCIPVDLNNVFITSSNPQEFIDKAEEDGLPRNTCNWIKGIYTAVMKKNVDEVIAVTEGDCSNTHALIELFRDAKIPVYTFAYPYGMSEKYNFLKNEILELCNSLKTDIKAVLKKAEELKPLRDKLKLLDDLTIEGKIDGFSNHLWLVSSTDFNSNVSKFKNDIDNIIKNAQLNEPKTKKIRIGFIGVPPIFSNIHRFVEEQDAQIVFNEIQRQFSIPSDSEDYVQKYIDYTYPYDIFYRLKDIKVQIKKRKINGIIHYVQSFCYRQIQDVIIKRELSVPVLTIEGNEPGEIDARTKIRIESFIEMLHGKLNG
jgi:benzoyl-CoA reductase/2-hydroxyglutaryl-CoA dehydratase subunit BcrC/BadD/HgdB